jgi:Esterase-like activity of phytase
MGLRWTGAFCLVLAAGSGGPPANATITLIADGTLTGSSAGSSADLSGLTGTPENGLPANLLGGLGSGVAYAGGETFLAVPDRGPNATPYNSNVDDTVSYINRFQTLTMSLTPSAPGSGSALPFTLTPTLTATTLLSSPTSLVYGSGAGLGVGSGAPAQNTPTKFYFTGRSDNFDPNQNSGNPNNARFDPESIRVSNDGKSVFISDEYGPYLYQFDRTTGQRIKSFQLPANLYVSNLSPQGAVEISGNTPSPRTARPSSASCRPNWSRIRRTCCAS